MRTELLGSEDLGDFGDKVAAALERFCLAEGDEL